MQAVTPPSAALRTSTSAPAQTASAAKAPVPRPAVDSLVKTPARAEKPLHTPPSYTVDGKKVVFSDIQKVDSVVVLDVAAKKSTVKATVEIEISEKGYPTVELVPHATKIRVDGKDMDPASYVDVRDPANESAFRIVGAELEAGKHTVEVEYELTAGVRYSGDSVEVFTRKSDLDNREMDEQYFPTNMEYDQYPGSITFDIRGTQAKHRVMTNGDVKEVEGKFVVTYPGHFNTASLFLNVINPARFSITEDVYQSMNGPIPVTVYSPTNLRMGKAPERLGTGAGLKPRAPTVSGDELTLTAADATARGMEIAKQALAKHEKDLGAYPHPRLLVRVSGSGGMEYRGATESDLGSLPHELHHQWGARGAQPANGNAGWLDEAAASWHDKGYPTTSSAPWGGRKLSGFPAWHRITPQAAYSHGESCLSYLDSVFAPKGGLRPVLKDFFKTYNQKVFTTEQFLAFLKDRGQGLNFDFDAFFKTYIYTSGLTLLRPRQK